MIDYIIVGQGLAGSILALNLLKEGFSVKVIDNKHHRSSSYIAGGLVHPMSFRRTILSWNAELLSEHSIHYYQQKEKEFNQYFFEPLTFLRIFGSMEEQNNWYTKQAIEPYNKVLFSFDKDLTKNGVKTPYGVGKVNWSYRLHVSVFLETVKKELQQKEALLQQEFVYTKLEIKEKGVAYQDIKAKGIIFCEGHQSIHNPFFDYLPENLTKGEILVVKSETLPNYALSRNCFLLPLGNKEYILGATYNWKDKDYKCTKEARKELLDKYSKISEEPLDILEQKAGIRPTTLDRKPILGNHPKFKNLFYFNGLGSKGVQLAPYYAEQMTNFLQHKVELPKEINLNRFTAKYFTKKNN